MQINESRRNDQAASVKFLIRASPHLVRRRGFRHLAVAQEHVHERVHPCQRIDDTAAANQNAV